MGLGLGLGLWMGGSNQVGTALLPPDPAQRVTLPSSLVKLDDLSPLVRNDNSTSSPLEIKAGPNGLIKIGSTPTMFFEAIQNTGYAANNGETAPMKATATTWQGPWTVSPSTRLFTAGDTTTWEYNEFSPSCVINNGGTLVMWAHGGNNNGPRQVGFASSTDGTTGLSWTKNGGNPLLTVGSAGAFDDKHLADFKLIYNPWLGSYIGLYRGVKNGDIKTDGTVGRVTLASPTSTPVKTGQVISSAPSWNTTGLSPGGLWYDAGGRLHMLVAGGTAGIGYYYSDDNGLTWTAGNSGNRVLQPGGTGNAYDGAGTGDVVNGLIDDGDVLFGTYGAENLSFATNPPLRSIAAFIVPAPKVSPTRKGKFHLSGAYSTVTAGATLNKNVYAIWGRFRAYRTNRAAARELYTEYNAFNLQLYVRIDNATGKLAFFHRSGAVLPSLASASAVDDAQWHTFLAVRSAANAFSLTIDNGTPVTSSLSPALSAATMSAAVGNWDPVSTFNEPSNFTISDLGICTDYVPTWSEIAAWIAAPQNSRPALGGGTLTLNYPNTAGTETGTVATVEGA